MPFIVQCPHSDCRKFMLLEDHVRGGKVACLACERAIELELPGSGTRPEPPPLRIAPKANLPEAELRPITACPRCHTQLRIPRAHEGKSIRCPACEHVFSRSKNINLTP